MGRRIRSGFFSTGPLHTIGDQVGVPCKVRKGNWRLNTLRIYCYTEGTDSLTLRLQLYKMADKKVGEPISIPDIRIPYRDSTQFITTDLSPYDLRVQGDFLLAVQLTNIHLRDTLGGLYFNGRLGARTYYRDKQYPDWGADKLGIGMSVEATLVPPISDTAVSGEN